MKIMINSIFRLLLVSLFVFGSIAKLSAQVTLLDQSVVTDEAFYFWKADDPKPYKYGAIINPHGNCIKVFNGYVFYTWYRGGWEDRTLMVSRKKIGSGDWKHVELPGKLSLIGQGLGDTHLTTNIGICPIDSSVHIMYDHHNEDLNYIRSKPGVAFGPDEDFALSGFLPQQDYLIPGNKITGVSYPDLFNNDAGEMFFERRLGSAVGGNIIITSYDGTEWSEEKMIIQGSGTGVSQGERNFCYGNAFPINNTMYYCYSVRWAESLTEANEGIYLMDVGSRMDKTATNVNGRSYDLPVIDQAPFLVKYPEFNGDYGSGTSPGLAISPKGDIYVTYKARDTDMRSYLRKAGETEFTASSNTSSLGQFYGNRMYKFEETGGYLYVKSCLAGTWQWRTDLQVNVGSNLDRSVIIMRDGYIAAVYKETMASATVPIHCFVFKIEKSEYTPQSITMDAISEKTEGDADFYLAASASSNLPVTFTSSNPNIARIVEGNKVQIMGPGTCDIMANQAGNGEFDNAPEVKKTLVVKANAAKQNQTISFALSANQYVWDSGDVALRATASSGLAVQYESTDTAVAIIIDGKVHVKRAGLCTINALQMGNASFNAAPVVGHELTVPKRKQIITVEALPEFNSGDQQYEIKATSNNPKANLRYVCPDNQVAIVWSYNIRECLATGSATITISEEGNDYFEAAEYQLPITVKPKVHPIPGSIEAEHCTSKEGVNVTRWSNFVLYLNSWGANDFAEYTIDVPRDGTYELEVFAASPGSSKKLKVMSGSNTLATLSLTVTSGLTAFKGTSANITLKQGVQNIKIVGVVGGYNFDRMEITAPDDPTHDLSFKNISNGDEIEEGTNLTIEANVGSAYKEVSLWYKSTNLGTLTSAPYTWSGHEALSNMQDSSYTFKLIAKDADNVTTQKSITVSVIEKFDLGALLDKLIFYYPLEENVNDLSENANHGTPGSAVTFATGKYGNAASFSYTEGSYFTSADSVFEYSAPTAYTIAFWVKVSDYSTRGDILQPTNGRTLLYSNGDLSFRCSHQKKTISFNVNEGEKDDWFHVALLLDQRDGQRKHQVLVNGEQRGGTAENYDFDPEKPQSLGKLIFGSFSETTLLRNFTGMLDEVCMFNEVLTEAEVKVLMKADDIKAYMANPSNVQILSSSKKIQLFPNPVHHNLTIVGVEVYQAEVYNLSGTMIKRVSVNNNILDVSSLENGAYILKMEDRLGSPYVSSFIKQ